MENLSLSVPDLLQTVKQFVEPEKHEQLDHMLRRYMQKELGKQQVGDATHHSPRPRCSSCTASPSRGPRHTPSRRAVAAAPAPLCSALTCPLRRRLRSCNSSCGWSLGATRCGKRC